VAADRIGQRSEGLHKRTYFDKGSIQVAEALSQEEPMGLEGRKWIESCLVVLVVVVVQLGNYVGTGTNGVGEGSLERNVAAANEWARSQDQD